MGNIIYEIYKQQAGYFLANTGRFMKKIIYLLTFLTANVMLAEDTLKVEKQKLLSVKSNMAVLLLQGFSLQTEFVLNKRTGAWAEATHHFEEHSMYNCALKETNFLAGINFYKLFKNPEGTKT